MPGRTYTQLDLVGSSEDTINHAITNCLSRTAKTVTNLDWFEVVQIRGTIAQDNVQYYQVEMKVGLRVLDPSERHPG